MSYLLVFSSLILLRYSLSGKIRAARQIYPYILILLFIFAAFRFEVGCDWGTYRMLHLIMHQPIQDLGAYAITQPGFTVLSKLSYLFGLDYYWTNFFSVLIFFIGINSLAKRSNDPLGFIILLFPILIINMPMSALKQGAAIGIMCFAYLAFIDQKLFRYIFFVIIASAFHPSAILFISFAPLLKGKLNIIAIARAILISSPILVIIAFSSTAELASERYINSANPEAAGAIFRILILVIFSTSFLLFFKNKWKLRFPSHSKIITLFSLCSFGLLAVFPISSVIADRFGYYFIPILTLFLANISSIKPLEMRAFWSSFHYLILLLMFISWTSVSYHFESCYQPYKSWLFGVPERERYYGDINEYEEAMVDPS